MGIDVAVRLVEVEVREWRVVRAGPGDQQVVNRCPQLVEEPFEPAEVEDIERRDAGAELSADALQAFRVARRDDQIRAFGASAPRCFEADA